MMTMKETITKVGIFTVGAFIGAAITYKRLKTKYEQITNDEIESIREYYRKNKEESEMADGKESSKDPVKAEMVKVERNKPAVTEYAAIIKKEGYEKDITESEKKKTVNVEDKPYVISPDEFGEHEDYEQISLTLYDDGYLADDMDELVNDVDEKIGWESLTHMGEYEDDALHVRNDKLKTDYEILRDFRTCPMPKFYEEE